MELIVDRLFVVGIQRPAVSQVGLLEHEADGLGSSAPLPRDSADDFGGRPAGLHQSPRAMQDGFSLVRGNLAELRAAAHQIGIQGDEPIDRTLQEAESLAAVHQEAPADQAMSSPARHGLRGDVELLGQLADSDDPLARGLHGHVGGVGKILDEQRQIVLGVKAVEFYFLIRIPADPRNAIADVLVGVNPVGNNLAQKFLGRARLFDLLLARSQADLLVPQASQGGNSILSLHLTVPKGWRLLHQTDRSYPLFFTLARKSGSIAENSISKIGGSLRLYLLLHELIF